MESYPNDVLVLWLSLVENPKKGRDYIKELFPEYTEKEISNLLTKTRRSHLISRVGGKTHARWIAVNHTHRMYSEYPGGQECRGCKACSCHQPDVLKLACPGRTRSNPNSYHSRSSNA